MISLEVFLFGLLITSTLTTLVTEALKSICNENNLKYRANTMAGVVALVLSVAIGAGYIIATGSAFNAQLLVCLVAQVFMSWLCAMVGYDKVVQAISQFKTTKEE